MRVLILGCGYVGLPLGSRLAGGGHEVFGVRRDASVARELEARGIHFLQGDITDRASLDRIEPRFDAVVNLVSSGRGGVEEYRRVYFEGTRNVLNWLKRSPRTKYIYTSSTSVYAQTDGSWVSENDPTEPQSPTSRILAETENELRSTSAIVLRVAGIYGAGRGHLFQQFLRGEATLRADGGSYINSIHVEDVAGTIIHLLEKGLPGTYNVADNEPVTQFEFFKWLSDVLEKPMPASAPADPNRKRGLTNKRVSNAKLRASGYTFRFSTFREGYSEEMRRLGLQM